MEIKRCYDTIVGASVGSNQLNKPVTTAVTTNGVTVTPNEDGSLTLDGTTTANGLLSGGYEQFDAIDGHKYFLRVYGRVINYQGYTPLGGNASFNETIRRATETGRSYARFRSENGTTYDNKKMRIDVVDLTQKFGSTIADYIYSLETATAGSGISKLREWGFLRGYQAFNAGSIKSVEVTGKKCVGFNQWDEEWEVGDLSNSGQPITASDRIRTKDFIHVIPSTTYYFKTGVSGQTSWQLFGCYYDEDKNFISTFYKRNDNLTMPSNCHYIKWATTGGYGTTYHNDICINLSSSRNGEYEAYTEQSYDYGADTLNGIFKLDANNQLYADGDVKSADGRITRKYGIRAYQSGDESLADAFTNGIQTVYKLTTPTTEQGDPFPSPQIVYPDGTEEYVTSNGVPVGHETRYEL